MNAILNGKTFIDVKGNGMMNYSDTSEKILAKMVPKILTNIKKLMWKLILLISFVVFKKGQFHQACYCW
jgi:hypothetical protein